MAAISIIIPVYNVIDYIERCLESVINQTFSDIEIIIVNDGSTDQSLLVVNRFAKADKRIRVITKENEGLAMARYTGVQSATSPYIYHLDGDDYIESSLLEEVYSEIINKEADILLFNFQYDYSNYSKPSVKYPHNEYSNIDLLKYLWRGKGYYAVWAYIHKRSLYDNVSFYKGLSFAEDAYLTTQLVYNAKKICYYDSKPLLHYIIRDSSISNGVIVKSKVDDILLYPELIRQFMQTKPEYSILEEDLVCLKLIAYNTLLQRNWFVGAKERSKESVLLIKKYPSLSNVPSVKAFKKLFILFAKNPTLALLFAKYYKYKGKIY